MALTDKLQAERAGLESYLDSERGGKLEQNILDRLETLYVLLGLTSSGGGGTSPVERVPSYSVVTGSFTILAGAKSVCIANSGNAAGTLLGASLPAGVSPPPFVAPNGDTLAAITGDATGTTFLISEVR